MNDVVDGSGLGRSGVDGSGLDDSVEEDAAAIIATGAGAGLTVATAESLTGGMVCASLVRIPGASAVLAGGVVAYQNSVKASILGVHNDLLDRAGSVDPEVAIAMAAGVRQVTGADVAVSTTGVAGPDTHDGKAVGTVYIGVSTRLGDSVANYSLRGDRERIRADATARALRLLSESIRGVAAA